MASHPRRLSGKSRDGDVIEVAGYSCAFGSCRAWRFVWRQFVTTKPTRVATVGMGYGDGYPRHVSGQAGDVWIRGQRLPILGRITMDQLMVDVTAAEEVLEGDEVELFGANIPVTEIAEKAGDHRLGNFHRHHPRVS
jgi:alanine racemase